MKNNFYEMAVVFFLNTDSWRVIFGFFFLFFFLKRQTQKSSHRRHVVMRLVTVSNLISAANSAFLTKVMLFWQTISWQIVLNKKFFAPANKHECLSLAQPSRRCWGLQTRSGHAISSEFLLRLSSRFSATPIKLGAEMQIDLQHLI